MHPFPNMQHSSLLPELVPEQLGDPSQAFGFPERRQSLGCRPFLLGFRPFCLLIQLWVGISPLSLPNTRYTFQSSPTVSWNLLPPGSWWNQRSADFCEGEPSIAVPEQPQVMLFKETGWESSLACYFWMLKFDLQWIFIGHKLFIIPLHILHLTNVKAIMNSWLYQTRQ